MSILRTTTFGPPAARGVLFASVSQRALALPRHQDEEDAQTLFWRKFYKDRVAQGLAASAADAKAASAAQSEPIRGTHAAGRPKQGRTTHSDYNIQKEWDIHKQQEGTNGSVDELATAESARPSPPPAAGADDASDTSPLSNRSSRQQPRQLSYDEVLQRIRAVDEESPRPRRTTPNAPDFTAAT